MRTEISNIKMLVIICTIALFIILFFTLPFDLHEVSLQRVFQPSTTRCWEKFKEEDCNVDQPTSGLCKELLECSTEEPKAGQN